MIFNYLATKAVPKNAGTIPASEVESRLGMIIEKTGITIPKSLAPKKIAENELLIADHIISFGCIVLSMFPPDKSEEWQIADP